MDHKSFLRKSTLLVLVIGLYFVSFPFRKSLNFPANAGENLPRIDISSLSEGEYKWYGYGESGGARRHHDGYLVINYQGVKVFYIAQRDGKFVMPDYHEWGVSGYCNNLSVSGGVISCNDLSIEEYQRDNWRWEMSGKNIKGQFANLYSYSFKAEGKKIVIGKKS